MAVWASFRCVGPELPTRRQQKSLAATSHTCLTWSARTPTRQPAPLGALVVRRGLRRRVEGRCVSFPETGAPPMGIRKSTTSFESPALEHDRDDFRRSALSRSSGTRSSTEQYVSDGLRSTGKRACAKPLAPNSDRISARSFPERRWGLPRSASRRRTALARITRRGPRSTRERQPRGESCALPLTAAEESAAGPGESGGSEALVPSVPRAS